MKSCTIVFLISFMFLVQANAGELVTQTFNLDMNQDPTALGWTVWNGPNGNGTHSISNGILTIDSSGFYELLAPQNKWVDIANSHLGWTVETRVKADSVFSYPGSLLQIWAFDKQGIGTLLEIYNDRIQAHNVANILSYSMDTTGFHTYKIVTNDNNLSVAVDGSQIFNFALTGGWGGTSSLMFGPSVPGQLHNVSEWDYISYSVVTPEPASAVLLLIGVCILKRRNSK